MGPPYRKVVCFLPSVRRHIFTFARYFLAARCAIRGHCERVVVCQPSKFPIVDQNDFGVTQLREFPFMDGLHGVIVSVFLRDAELLGLFWWNMELDPLADRFTGGMAWAIFDLDHSVS